LIVVGGERFGGVDGLRTSSCCFSLLFFLKSFAFRSRIVCASGVTFTGGSALSSSSLIDSVCDFCSLLDDPRLPRFESSESLSPLPFCGDCDDVGIEEGGGSGACRGERRPLIEMSAEVTREGVVDASVDVRRRPLKEKPRSLKKIEDGKMWRKTSMGKCSVEM
jgi:hypothetical protein